MNRTAWLALAAVLAVLSAACVGTRWVPDASG